MLWTILVILLVLWLLGVIGHVGGGNQPLGQRHVVLGQEHDLEPIARDRIRIEGRGHVVQQLDHQLGQALGATANTKGLVACTDTGSSADCTVTITFDDSRAGVGGNRVQKVITRAML